MKYYYSLRVYNKEAIKAWNTAITLRSGRHHLKLTVATGEWSWSIQFPPLQQPTAM